MPDKKRIDQNKSVRFDLRIEVDDNQDESHGSGSGLIESPNVKMIPLELPQFNKQNENTAILKKVQKEQYNMCNSNVSTAYELGDDPFNEQNLMNELFIDMNAKENLLESGNMMFGENLNDLEDCDNYNLKRSFSAFEDSILNESDEDLNFGKINYTGRLSFDYYKY